MSKTPATSSNENVAKFDKQFVKAIIIRIAVPIAVTVIATQLCNVIEKKLNESDSTTSDND